MKADSAINYLVIDMLKNILNMADNPAELGKYITSQIRELIGCKSVILLCHNEINQEVSHQLIGICPERKAIEFDQKKWNEIAEISHSFHKPTLFQHKTSGNKIEQLLSQIDGEYSIIIPLDISEQRVGILCVINISDIQNLQSIIDSLDALSGVLAIELRNAIFLQNMETIVAQRTKELSDSEKRFRAIIEQATDAMYLSDMDGNIIDVNKRACESLGYTRDELLKLKVTDLDVEYDETKKMKSSFEKMKPNENFTFESVHSHINGKSFPVEISSSIIELDGTLNVIGFVRDISERKENELKVIRTAQHYKALIENAPDGIVLIDAMGDFKFVSPSARKIFGYSDSEEITGSPAQFTHPDDLDAVLSLLENITFNSSSISPIQYRFADINGRWRWVESTFSNLLEDPSVEAIVINFRDITDRKLAEEEVNKLNEELEHKVVDRTIELEKRSFELIENEAALLNLVEDLNLKSEELQNSTRQLQATNKELEAFSYSVSHDLRAPLRAINGFVNILNEEYGNILDDEGKRICSIIHSNAVKMGQLIDDLLSFSRLIRSELNQSTIDMQSMVHSLITEFKSSKELNPNVISLHDLPQSKGDTNLIKQVWINLISNAIKYSSKTKNPKIIIGATQNNNETVYFIKDNGVGFNMSYSHKLFGVFQRLHGSNEFEGTGVGLAIVQRIITRHGGRVWAESEIDKGATFYFALPRNKIDNL